MTDKSALRLRARALRSGYVAQLDSMAHRLAFRALPSPLRNALSAARSVALYVALDDEAPAQRLAEALIAEGKTLALPVVLDRLGTMEFREWTPGDDLEDGPFRTRGPAVDKARVIPDAILAPLIAFDEHMTRLGQGGGYYDRAFARYPEALRIGVGWSVQQFDNLPADPWDLPLHAVLTEKSFITPVSAGDFH